MRADVVTRTGTSMRAQITPLPETVERTIEVDAHVRRIQELIEKALSLATGLSEELRSVVMNIDDPLRLVYVLASLLDIKPAEKQAILEENDLLEEAAGHCQRADARDLAARAQGQDRVAGAAGNDRRAAAVLPAAAAEGHPAGARRRRRQRDRRDSQADRGREAARSGARVGDARGRSAGAHGSRLARIPDAADLYRLAARCAVVRHDARSASIRSKRERCSTRITTTSTRSRSASSSTWPYESSKAT